jgi:hypothetical protein
MLETLVDAEKGKYRTRHAPNSEQRTMATFPINAGQSAYAGTLSSDQEKTRSSDRAGTVRHGWRCTCAIARWLKWSRWH